MDRTPVSTTPYRRERLDRETALSRLETFSYVLQLRRSIREFSPEPVPAELLELAIATAASAPSGANMQPWKFVVVRNINLKRAIREAAEEEERVNYAGRMPPEWIEALRPLGTDWRKEFLDVAPALIVVFKEDYHEDDGRRINHYYPTESVGIACGFLLAALNAAGLATLTHTPSPMNFLREILGRPRNEKPFLLIPVGYPAESCTVPMIERKPLREVLIVCD